MITLLEALDNSFAHLKIDKKLCDRAFRFQTSFVHRNSEHLKFFGGNLIGVESIRWRTSDTVNFCNDVCDIDYTQLERSVRTVTTIVHEFKITSDPLNLALMYLIHKALTSPSIVQKARERLAYDLALVFFYRCITIRQSEYFHFPADPKVSQAAYAQLNKKFLLKRLGSWGAVMDYRATELISEESIHLKPLQSFTDDLKIVYAISDSENRIRDMYKNYYKVFNQAYEEGNRIYSVSSTVVDMEGKEKIREKVKSTELAVNYIRTVIVDKPSFVKPELLSIVSEINTNTSQRMLSSTVEWLADNYNSPQHHKQIDEWMRLIIVHSYHLLAEASPEESRDLASAMLLLKNLYLSTRSIDKELLQIREIGDKLIIAAAGRVNRSLAMSTRTAIILYITLRSLVSRK